MIEVKRAGWNAALESLEIEPEDVRPDYMGRSMYGKTTIAIVLDSEAAIFELMAAFGVFCEADEARGLAAHAATDALGHSLVVYWPGGLTIYDEEEGT